jgi:hypothetical protein
MTLTPPGSLRQHDATSTNFRRAFWPRSWSLPSVIWRANPVGSASRWAANWPASTAHDAGPTGSSTVSMTQRGRSGSIESTTVPMFTGTLDLQPFVTVTKGVIPLARRNLNRGATMSTICWSVAPGPGSGAPSGRRGTVA